ncbi:caspase family protein [Bacillus thuringiensis]|uniref:caspase family protein n=1 Tax=Bacillus thuringiensis TaxID=1428 RepID=UPI000BF5135A|nr:caspase family protein [Bacillus thuringiensis]PFB76795.1 peptidase c14 caspase catalytic subunit p20 [Bacillus thuringiensis]PGN31375.1 peptidase c14 caspase catalytic subunit p20 [Bacillus thuringiensis]
MPKGFSLHIGLNSVDPQHYAGWNGELVSCEEDAKDMEAIATSLHYEHTSKLLTTNATIDNVVKEIKNAASSLESGDIFFLTYSGHGAQIPDQGNEETDGFDETWCLYDGQFLDDELYSLWSLFKEDVRVVVLSDSCFSGTITRARYYDINDFSNINPVHHIAYKFMPPAIRNRTFEKNRDFYIKKQSLLNEINTSEIRCSVKLISGCQENQLSADGAYNGLFTETLLSVWRNGAFNGNFKQFHKKIVDLMPPDQTPNLLDIGKRSADFDKQKPFEINLISQTYSDSTHKMPVIDENKMNTISIHRFVFVMKAIAENNLWDDMVLYFEEKGQDKILLSPKHIALLKDLFTEKVKDGETINKRARLFLSRCGCSNCHNGGDGGAGGGGGGGGGGTNPQ